jgi:hypothetical protein
MAIAHPTGQVVVLGHPEDKKAEANPLNIALNKSMQAAIFFFGHGRTFYCTDGLILPKMLNFPQIKSHRRVKLSDGMWRE